MPPEHSSDAQALIHRALADPSRVSILSTLRRDEAAKDATELAEAVGLHPNTVRSHLRQLQEAGLVVARRDAQGKPGRPHIVFEAAEPSDETQEALEAYRLLAQVLAQSVGEREPDPTQRAETTARELAGECSEEDGPVAHAVRFLSRLGFDPLVRTRAGAPAQTEIVMRACPFEDLGPDQLELACSVHRGLIRGVLRPETTGGAAVELHAEPGSCVARLATAS